MAYALQVDYAERLEVARYQAALTARAMGSDVEIPTPGDMKRQLDEWLVSDAPEVVEEDEPFETTWIRVMGLEAAS